MVLLVVILLFIHSLLFAIFMLNIGQSKKNDSLAIYLKKLILKIVGVFVSMTLLNSKILTLIFYWMKNHAEIF